MKKIFLLMGNFGCGKTSVTGYHPHTKIEGEPLSEVRGLISLGGERGADELSKKGYDKEKVYTELIPKYKDRDIFIHSVFFQGIQDVNRYLNTHEVVVLGLRTPYEVNAQRIQKRSGGKKKIDDKTFITTMKQMEKVRQFCMYSKSKYYRIDNARPLSQVAKEVWEIIDAERNYGDSL
jgi:hypothetical protein